MKTRLVFIFVISFCLSGCDNSPYVHTFGETSAERVAVMTDIIKKRTSLPGSILDAECIEEQYGDGRFGPSDFAFFAKLVVEKADFATWKSSAGKRISNWDYKSPKKASLSWWSTKEQADQLEMYSPKPMFRRSNGWVGFAADGQTIYILTFTM